MRYNELENWRADRVVVFDITDHLRKSFEDFVNTYHKEVTIKDVLMGVHNFHKLVLMDMVDRGEMPTEEARVLLQISVDTYQKSVDDYIQRRRTEGK